MPLETHCEALKRCRHLKTSGIQLVYGTCMNSSCVVTGHCSFYCYAKKTDIKLSITPVRIALETRFKLSKSHREDFIRSARVLNSTLNKGLACFNLNLGKFFIQLQYESFLVTFIFVFQTCQSYIFFPHAAIVYVGLLAKESTQKLRSFFFAFDCCHVTSAILNRCLF